MAEEAGESQLLRHLQRIPPSTSEETLEKVLQALWATRKTGLGSTRKPEIQTLFALPTPQHLDPVLACLRLVIRKCVNGDDVQNLLRSVDISADLRRALVNVLHENQNQWKEEASVDQPLWPRTRVSHQVKVNVLPALASFPGSELLTSLWPRQDDASSYPHGDNLGGGPAAGFADPGLAGGVSLPFHQDTTSTEDTANIPRLKSMTWKMENRSLTPANRVAIITLKVKNEDGAAMIRSLVTLQLYIFSCTYKDATWVSSSTYVEDSLQDYTKSPSGEIEVKFQLSKDTLDAMLRSMAYISEQLLHTLQGFKNPHHGPIYRPYRHWRGLLLKPIFSVFSRYWPIFTIHISDIYPLTTVVGIDTGI